MTNRSELIEIIESEKYIVGLRPDDIVHVYFKKGTTITISLQEEMIFVYNDITSNQKMKFIYEADKKVGITNEARKNAIKLENIAPISAAVIITNNPIQRMIADFYYFINRPKYPYNVFTKFDEGIKWLNELDF